MALGDLYSLQMRYTVHGKLVTNNFGYFQTGGPPEVDDTRALTRAFNADIVPLFQSTISNDVTIQSLYALAVNPPGQLPSELALLGLTGNDPGEVFPSNSAWVMRVITDSNSSKNNGRIFFTGFAETATEDQALTPAYINGVAGALATALVNTIADPLDNTRTFDLAVINRVDAGVRITPPNGFRVNQLIIVDTIYTQRRRQTKESRLSVG